MRRPESTCSLTKRLCFRLHRVSSCQFYALSRLRIFRGREPDGDKVFILLPRATLTAFQTLRVGVAIYTCLKYEHDQIFVFLAFSLCGVPFRFHSLILPCWVALRYYCVHQGGVFGLIYVYINHQNAGRGRVYKRLNNEQEPNMDACL